MSFGSTYVPNNCCFGVAKDEVMCNTATWP